MRWKDGIIIRIFMVGLGNLKNRRFVGGLRLRGREREREDWKCKRV